MSGPSNVSEFRSHIINSGILDPEGVHHEFVTGMHGQKLDFDLIGDRGPLYKEWIDVAADFIRQEFSALPEVILGVARGTNRVALDIARRFDGAVYGAVSEKDKGNSQILRLSQAADRLVAALRPELVVVLEDVGNTGFSSVQVARRALAAGAKDVEVVATWKRRERLERLEEAGISYRAIIDEALATYTPEKCQTEGYCAKGWKYIERER